MTQRDLAIGATAALGGLAVGALLGWLLLRGPDNGFIDGGGPGVNRDKTTQVTLSTIKEACTLAKATHVWGVKGNHLTWDIANYCTDGPKTVWVGNFRADTDSAAIDCTDQGPTYPFDPRDLRSVTVPAARTKSNGEIDPGVGNIKLKVKERGELGNLELVYYFDVCLGTDKVDPVLVIER